MTLFPRVEMRINGLLFVKDLESTGNRLYIKEQ